MKNWITAFFAAAAIMTVGAAHAEFIDPVSVAPYAPTILPGDKPLVLQACKPATMTPGIQPESGAFRCASATVEAGSQEIKGRFGQFAVYLRLDTRKRYKLGAKEEDFGFLESVHSADLNGDNEPDFILEFGYRGNGLAATIRNMVFLVSGPQSYSWQHIPRLRSPAAAQFYLSDGGRAVFLTSRTASDATSTRAIPSSKDRKQHNYWVFQPIYFNKGTGLWSYIPQANWPIWVQYTREPQNKPTDLIEYPTIKRITQSPLANMRGGQMQAQN